MKTRELLDSLKRTGAPHSIGDDIIRKIDEWKEKNKNSQNAFVKFMYRKSDKLKEFFTTPPEIKALQEQISGYNSNIFNFIKLYFKESSPEYKEKIKTSIKTVWANRKKAKAEIARIKKEIREKKRQQELLLGSESFLSSFVKELNALTGWLLSFYIIYYFLAIYLTTKDFGLLSIPKSITVYESHTFKYILVVIFLLHASTSLKVNFFKKSFIADLILIPFFFIGSTIALLNL